MTNIYINNLGDATKALEFQQAIRNILDKHKQCNLYYAYEKSYIAIKEKSFEKAHFGTNGIYFDTLSRFVPYSSISTIKGE